MLKAWAVLALMVLWPLAADGATPKIDEKPKASPSAAASAVPSPAASPSAPAGGTVTETKQFISVTAPFAPDIQRNLNALLADGEATLAKCKAKSSTYEETFLVWDRMCGEIDAIGSFGSWDFNTGLDPKVRERGEKAEELVSKVIARLYTLKFPYNILKDAFDRLKKNLPVQRKAYAEDVLRGFEHNGVHLEGASKERVKSIDQELIEIGTRFSKVLKDREITVPVSDAQAKEINKKYLKEDPKSSKKLAVLRESSYLDIMRRHPDRNFREKAFKSYFGGTEDQSEDLNQMRRLRREKAQLVKKTTYANLEMEDEGFTLAQVRATLEELKQRTNVSFQAVMKDYRELNKGETPKAYDLAYLEETAPVSGVNSDQLLQYFTATNVVRTLLDLSRRLYGLTFKLQKRDEKNRIEVYSVTDRTGQEIGTVTLDLFPRANKYNHAACWTMQGRATACPKRQAILGLAANLNERPLPEGGHGILLDEVTTVFHEFGHVLHGLLINSEMIGAHNVPRSLVEVPSQVFEAWILDPLVLAEMALHYKTGKPIPEDLRAVVYKKSQRFSARHVRTQCLYALFDLDFHEKTNISPQRVWDGLAQDLFGKKFYPSGIPWFTRFGHLDGYGAKYWGYKFADLGKAQIYWNLVHDFPNLTSEPVGQKLEEKLMVFGGLQKLSQVAPSFTGQELTALPYVLETLVPYPVLRAKIVELAKAGKNYKASLEGAFHDLIEAKSKDVPSPAAERSHRGRHR
jgi:thimet oligopeptidase